MVCCAARRFIPAASARSQTAGGGQRRSLLGLGETMSSVELRAVPASTPRSATPSMESHFGNPLNQQRLPPAEQARVSAWNELWRRLLQPHTASTAAPRSDHPSI